MHGDEILKGLSKEERKRRRTAFIEPTDEECAKSMPGRVTQCMYAAALRRVFPSSLRAQVDLNGATVTDQGIYWRYKISRKAGQNALKFDRGEVPPLKERGVKLTLIECRVISSVTPERQKQINEARRKRREEGRPDKAYNKALRLRVVEKKTVHQKRLGV